MIDIATVRKYENEPRSYIGASGIGETCSAYHALCMRGFPSDVPSPKMIRIFREGHNLEKQAVADLRAAGHEVEDVDQRTGKQWSYTSHGGHHRANLDGRIKLVGSPEWMHLEIKSMNRAMFKAFQSHGLRKSHPEYFAQVQDGLMLAKYNNVAVDQCLLVAVCKDNSEYHAEVIAHGHEHSQPLLKRVEAAYNGEGVREMQHEKAYKCTQCFKQSACWRRAKPEVLHCSHCKHSEPSIGAGDRHWRCTLNDCPAVSICGSFELYHVEKA